MLTRPWMRQTTFLLAGEIVAYLPPSDLPWYRRHEPLAARASQTPFHRRWPKSGAKRAEARPRRLLPLGGGSGPLRHQLRASAAGPSPAGIGAGGPAAVPDQESHARPAPVIGRLRPLIRTAPGGPCRGLHGIDSPPFSLSFVTCSLSAGPTSWPCDLALTASLVISPGFVTPICELVSGARCAGQPSLPLLLLCDPSPGLPP